MARATCALPSYAGQKPRLTQWTDGVRDYNILCPGITGRAASGNLPTPYLNVRLSLGSRGEAVRVLQRHWHLHPTGARHHEGDLPVNLSDPAFRRTVVGTALPTSGRGVVRTVIITLPGRGLCAG